MPTVVTEEQAHLALLIMDAAHRAGQNRGLSAADTYDALIMSAVFFHNEYLKRGRHG
jgi:hypothetical protein